MGLYQPSQSYANVSALEVYTLRFGCFIRETFNNLRNAFYLVFLWDSVEWFVDT